jgi:hypothetical protein
MRPRTEESGVVSWRCDWNVGRLQFRLRIDFTLEAGIATEICATMRYLTPNAVAVPLLPDVLRANPAIFPPPTRSRARS